MAGSLSKVPARRGELCEGRPDLEPRKLPASRHADLYPGTGERADGVSFWRAEHQRPAEQIQRRVRQSDDAVGLEARRRECARQQLATGQERAVPAAAASQSDGEPPWHEDALDSATTRCGETSTRQLQY